MWGEGVCGVGGDGPFGEGARVRRRPSQSVQQIPIQWNGGGRRSGDVGGLGSLTADTKTKQSKSKSKSKAKQY